MLNNNMLAYCNNNPTNYFDPYGTDCVLDRRTAFSSGGGFVIPIIPIIPIGWLENIFYKGNTNSSQQKGDKNNQGSPDKPPQKPTPEVPKVTYPGNDPTKAPDGYEWKGPDAQGGPRGGYKNPNGKDSWHPDLNHPDGIDPHWDYNDIYGHKWRVFPNRIEFVK